MLTKSLGNMVAATYGAEVKTRSVQWGQCQILKCWPSCRLWFFLFVDVCAMGTIATIVKKSYTNDKLFAILMFVQWGHSRHRQILKCWKADSTNFLISSCMCNGYTNTMDNSGKLNNCLFACNKHGHLKYPWKEHYKYSSEVLASNL